MRGKTVMAVRYGTGGMMAGHLYAFIFFASPESPSYVSQYERMFCTTTKVNPSMKYTSAPAPWT
jgi:hypothetical protein